MVSDKKLEVEIEFIEKKNTIILTFFCSRWSDKSKSIIRFNIINFLKSLHLV
jgi:hypothetical protein